MKKEATRASESDSDRNRESFSVRLETAPRLATRVTLRPLEKELARPIEPLRDLNSEVCCPRPEDCPIDPVRVLDRPLVSKQAIVRVPTSDLTYADFSAMLEAEANDALINLEKPMWSMRLEAGASAPASDLK